MNETCRFSGQQPAFAAGCRLSRLFGVAETRLPGSSACGPETAISGSPEPGTGRIQSRMPIMTTALATTIAVVAVVAVARSASASPLLETVGSANSPTPFSARIIPTGPDSAFFNPSLLLHADPGFRVGFFYLHQDLKIDYRARPSNADIPETVYDSRPLPGYERPADMIRPVATSRLVMPRGGADPSGDLYFIGFGSVHHFIPDRFGLGFFMFIPVTSFQAQQPFFSDEREQVFSNSLHFELYEDRLKNASFALSLAGRPVKWLTLGLGLTLSTNASTTSRVFLSEINHETPPVIAPEVNITTSFVPQAAITFEPVPNLLISTMFHWRYVSSMTTDHQQQIWGFKDAAGNDVMEYRYGFAYGYQPLRLGLGISWTGKAAAGRLEYTVAGSFAWAKWSDYRDRRNESPVQQWSDRFPVTLAGIFRVGNAHEIGIDMTFVQSPVPNQDGRSNYVDNDRFGIATGYSYRFKVSKFEMSVGAQLQFHYLLPRSVNKSNSSANPLRDEYPDSIMYGTDEFVAASAGIQTNNPGFPGYSSRGWMMGAGVQFSFHH